MISIPGYVVESPLGRGSQAQVYYGRAEATGVRVALKLLHTATSEALAGARAEAALLAGLAHPNLLRLIEYVVVDNSAVLVLELAEGGSLADLLSRRGRLSPAEVVAAISPVGAALALAHDEGIRHGDVSAANILFDRVGQPKLADLGIARMFGGRTDWLGTPAYLDPTVAAGGVPGPASDVFALAAVALHALTGRGPWHPPVDRPAVTRATISRPAQPATAEDLIARAASGRVPELADRLRDHPPELATVLMRGLDSDPRRRGSAAAFALDLRASVRPRGGVVLGGGRIAREPGRHSAEHQRGDREVGSAERPAFARPRAEGVSAGGRLDRVPADLTHLRRPLIRQPESTYVRPAGGLRRRIHNSPARGRSDSGPVRRRLLTGGAVGIALAGSACIALVAVAGAGRQADRASAATASVAPTSSDTAVSTPAKLLARLDAMRSAAYATRNPAALDRVYRSATLLAADRVQLQNTVPTGCELTGLHTSYRDITSVRQPQGLTVSVTVTVGAAALNCKNTLTDIAATAPQRLTVELVGTGSDVRIAAEQLTGG